MRKKKVTIVGLLIATILALSAQGTYAASYNDGSGQEQNGAKGKWAQRRESLYKDLNLTETQKKQLEDNRNKHREEMKALFNKMKETRASLRHELQKEPLDMTKITQANDGLKSLQAEMLDHRLRGILEVRKILTPEQFAKMMLKMEKRQGHVGENKR